MDYQARRDRLRKSLKKSGADALLVTNFANVTYLTGFTGEDSFLLVREDSQVLISDGRFTTQLEEECPGLDVHIRGTDRGILSAVLRLVQSTKTNRLAIEGDSMTVGSMNRLAEKLPQERILPTSGLVEKLRQIKDKEEVTKIREAVWYAEKAFGVVRSLLRPEQTEKQIADELENQFRRFGGGGASFPPIVAVGERGALPHANPTDKQVGEADFVLIDWGAQGTLYKSDLTRVLVTGKILPKLRRVYEVVLQAQTRAIAAIRPGVAASEIDAVARGVITDAGFGRRFNHGLGHGVGLDIHEAPRLSRKSATVLRPGMVITVEPGVYLPGWGGVRIEDDVLVTRTGHEVLTHVPKQLDEMVVN